MTWLQRTGVAIALNIIAASISATFTFLTLFCGAMTTEAVEPGQASAPARCVASLHPVAPIQFVLAVGAAVAVYRGAGPVAFGIGMVSLPLGFLVIFSGGYFTFVPGLLSFIAGIVGWERRRRPADPPTATETAAPPLP